MKTQLPIAIALFAVASIARGGTPLVYCTDNVVGIQFALDAAHDNGQDDVIRLVGGTYALTAGLAMMTAETNTLDISGGWNADCTQQTGGTTVLDGQGQFLVLSLESTVASDIHVSRIDFSNGYRPSVNADAAAGLVVRSLGNLLIEQNLLVLNQHDGSYTGGLYAYVGGAGTLTVRNNLFFGNSSPHAVGAADLYANGGGEAYVNGNTAVANQMTANGETGGIFLRGTAHFTLANNILWNNTGGDLYIGVTGGTLLRNDDIGVLAGFAAEPGSAGNLDVDPVFAGGPFNFRLASRSPLVNAGLDAPPGGAGTWDAAGAPRLQLPHLDIGAFETDVIFYSGWELLP